MSPEQWFHDARDAEPVVSALPPEAAATFTWTPNLPRVVAGAHRIPTFLADRIIQPMIAELLLSGTWSIQPRRGAAGYFHVVRDLTVCDLTGHDVCHALLIDIRGRRLLRYNAVHSDRHCPSELPPRTSHDTDPHYWRQVLRAVSTLGIVILASALGEYGSRFQGRELTEESCISLYMQASHGLARMRNAIPAQPGDYDVRDGSTRWRIRVSPGPLDPVVVGARPLSQDRTLGVTAWPRSTNRDAR